MSWLKKNIIWLAILVILLGVYGAVAYGFLFRNDMSIEYDYFYRQQLTQYWGGDGTLSLNPYSTTITY